MEKPYGRLNESAHLAENLFDHDIKRLSTRDGFGTGIVEVGGNDERVVVLTADLMESTCSSAFAEKFPKRFFETGVAEQNMVAVASGMAAAGMVPFVTSYAVFSPGRNYEHIRTTVALNRANVKVCGTHAGVSVGPDGASHQMLEDIGMMRMLPDMTVVAPADAEEAHKAVIQAAENKGPIYLRFNRARTPVFTTPESPFEIGKALRLFDADAPNVAIMATGPSSYEALAAARALAAEGVAVSVLHVPTIKPLDEDNVLAEAKRASRVVTVEEHQIAGGFGSAVAELISERHPMPVLRIGVRDVFGQSGSPEELASYYGLDAIHIADAIRSFIERAY